VDDQIDLEEMALQMISKMEFAVQFHESLLENVDWA
jgi:hypothetical protein